MFKEFNSLTPLPSLVGNADDGNRDCNCHDYVESFASMVKK